MYAPLGAAPTTFRASGSYAPMTRAALLGPAQSGVIIVAGRQVPLPSGEWHLAVRQTQPAGAQVHSEVLVQLAGNRVAAIVIARGTSVLSDDARKLPFAMACESSAAFESRVLPTGGTARECRAVTPVYLPSSWRAQGADPLYLRTLDTVAQAGLQLPPVMAAASWYRADALSWMEVHCLFDPASDSAASKQLAAWTPQAVMVNPAALHFVQQVARWSAQWTPLLEKGAAGLLSAADLSAAAGWPALSRSASAP